MIEGTGRTNRGRIDLKWAQVKKSKETKNIMTLRTALHMAFMTKLVMASNRSTIK